MQLSTLVRKSLASFVSLAMFVQPVLATTYRFQISSDKALAVSSATPAVPSPTTPAVPQGFATYNVSALDFPIQQVLSTSSFSTVTITNAGQAPLVFSSIAIAGGSSNFEQNNDCSTLAVGASCAVRIAFSPTTPEAITGALTLAHNGRGASSINLSGSAQAASATLSSPSFSTTGVGENVNATATLLNTGRGVLSIVRPSAIDVNGAAFSFSSTTCTATLSAGDSCLVAIQFSPINVDAQTGSLTLETNSGTLTSEFTTTATQGFATISESLLTFAPQQTDSSSSTKTVTVRNSGTRVLTFSRVGIGSGSAQFAQSNNCSAISPGSTCTVNVSFTPLTAGSLAGTLVFAHNGGGLATVALTGVGQVPSGSLSLPSFSATSVNGVSLASATLTNTGLGPLSVTAPAAGSVSGLAFSFASTTCPASLAVGANCSVSVRFSPTGVTSQAGSLIVATGAGSLSTNFSSTGTQGFATLSESALSFATLQIADSSAAKTITVTNTGTSALTFSSVGIATGAGSFAQSNTCASIPAAGICTVNVSFTPASAGALAGSLVFAHNGGGLSTVALSGTGQAQSGSLSVPSFSSTAVSGNSVATATLANTGVGTLSVNGPAAGSVSGSAFSFASTTCQASLAVGANCSVSVRFSPTGVTSQAGSLIVATGAGSLSTNFSSTGTQGFATLSDSALAFTTLQVADSSAAKAITVTNTGTSALTFSSVGIATGAGSFAQSNTCASIPAAGTCTVNVSFTPASAGALAGSLVFVHNGGGLSTVALSGTGQAQSGSLSVPSFSSTAVSGNSVATTTLANTGLGTLSVNAPAAGSVSGSAFSFASTTCPASLAVGANCSVSVRFSPTGVMSQAGSLIVATGAGSLSANFSSTATQGFASLSDSALAFSTLQVADSSVAKTITVTNTGTSALTFSSVGIATGAGSFAQSNTCASIPTAGTCTVNVSFTPASAGALAGSLVFVHNGGGLSTVALSGTGQAQSGSLSVPSFSSTAVSGNSVATATLVNTGLGTLSVTAPAAGSVSGSAFSFASTTCLGSLEAGANCSVSVRFSPTGVASQAGSLMVATGAGSLSANFSSTGTQGFASLSDSALNLGNAQAVSALGGVTQAGSTSTKTVTLTNSGTRDLTIASIGVIGDTPSFAQTNNCAIIAANSTCTVNVSFTPSKIGSLVATLVFSHDGGGIATVALAGTGMDQSYSTTSMNFNPTVVGEISYGTSTLTNTGVGPLYLQYAIPVTANNVFAIASSTCPLIIPAGATCAVSLKFIPTTLGVSAQTTLLISRVAKYSVSPIIRNIYVPVSGAGIAGSAVVSASTILFPDTQVLDTAATKAISVTNTGTSALSLAGISVVAGASDFSQSNNCSTIAVASTCTVNVSFTPTTAAILGGSLAIQFNNGGGFQTVSLSGTGRAQSATRTMSSFVSTALGGTSQGQAVITNTGIGAISLGTYSATSLSSSSAFSFVSTTCTPSLAAGASCVVTVQFAPTNMNLRTVTLTSVIGGATFTDSFSSTAIAAFVTLSGSALSFSAQQVGTTSATKGITVTNAGSSSLTFLSVGVATGASDFAQTNNCATVAAGGSCTVNVAFTPTGPGTLNGTLALMHNGGAISTVTLAGTGQYQSGTLSTPTFPAAQVGGFASANLTLTNTGVGDLSFVTPSASSVSGTAFSFGGKTCLTSLAVGASCTVTVNFNPSYAETATGGLTVFSTDAGSISKTFTATGLQGFATLSSSSLTFAATQLGDISGKQAATLTNTGTYSLTISNATFTAGATNYSLLTGCGVVAVGGTCAVFVDFTPKTVGVLPGTISLTHNGGGAKTLNLSGTGINSGTLTLGAIDATLLPTVWFPVTLKNTGSTSFTILRGISTLSINTDFSKGTCTINGVLAANATCDYRISYTRPVTGNTTGVISVVTGIGNISQTITIN